MPHVVAAGEYNFGITPVPAIGSVLYGTGHAHAGGSDADFAHDGSAIFSTTLAFADSFGGTIHARARGEAFPVFSCVVGDNCAFSPHHSGATLTLDSITITPTIAAVPEPESGRCC